ncbi:hypothetical protein ACFQ38_16085 [Sporosarcina contaminans]|uniref:Uncharacterized protein n=1 Tax=Sporosarcina contaminans TaxID=633403 RepID=A0ABW3U0I1_9BACL
MLNMEKSNVHCLVCDHQFIVCDAEVIEEWELPICDPCIKDMCSFRVKYDGSRDLLEFLTEEIKGSECPGCLKSGIELHGIRYDSTVWGHGLCSECKQGWNLEIHIEFA